MRGERDEDESRAGEAESETGSRFIEGLFSGKTCKGEKGKIGKGRASFKQVKF